MYYSIPGIINVLDYTMKPGLGEDPQANATALQNAIDDAEKIGMGTKGGGGIILIPSNDSDNDLNVYVIAPPTGLSYCVRINGQYPLLIMGTGGATTLLVQGGGDLFTIGGSDTAASLTFQDLIVQYDQSGGFVSGTAFNLNSANSAALLRVKIQDCQNPIYFANTLYGSVSDCSISFSSAYPTTESPTCLEVDGGSGSQQIDIDGCVFDIPTTITDSVGMLFTFVDSGLRVRDTQITGAVTGIQIIPDSHECFDMWFTSLQVSATSTAVYIQPQSSDATIHNINFVNCDLEYIGSYAIYTPGILVDTNGGPNSILDTVRFENCACVSFPNNGLSITGGQNISVVGGVYAANANAGIVVSGTSTLAPENIIISGAACLGTSTGASRTQVKGIVVEDYVVTVSITDCNVSGNSSDGVTVTTSVSGVWIGNCNITANGGFGVAVSGSCSDVYVNASTLTGNTSGALNASTPGSLQVTNCPGYNDQVQLLATAIPVSSGTDFNGTNGTLIAYYGPVVFYLTSVPSTGPVTGVSIGGTPTTLIGGTFFLPAPAPTGGVFAQITYTGTPSFLMFGK